MAKKTYAGSCHCKNVRFEVTTELDGAGACNCSICSRVGWLMKSVPPEDFVVLAGEKAQTDYQFAGKTMHHLFCTTCGVHAYGRYVNEGAEKIVVNLRCLEDLAIDSLKVETFDGKSF